MYHALVALRQPLLCISMREYGRKGQQLGRGPIVLCRRIIEEQRESHRAWVELVRSISCKHGQIRQTFRCCSIDADDASNGAWLYGAAKGIVCVC